MSSKKFKILIYFRPLVINKMKIETVNEHLSYNVNHHQFRNANRRRYINRRSARFHFKLFFLDREIYIVNAYPVALQRLQKFERT